MTVSVREKASAGASPAQARVGPNALVHMVFRCVVEQVISGDYLILMVDLGFDDLHKRVRARLNGVDTPDAYRCTSGSEASVVREEVSRLCAEADHCFIHLDRVWNNKWFVTLHSALRSGDKLPVQTINVNEMLIRRGYIYRTGAPAITAAATGRAVTEGKVDGRVPDLKSTA